VIGNHVCSRFRRVSPSLKRQFSLQNNSSLSQSSRCFHNANTVTTVPSKQFIHLPVSLLYRQAFIFTTEYCYPPCSAQEGGLAFFVASTRWAMLWHSFDQNLGCIETAGAGPAAAWVVARVSLLACEQTSGTMTCRRHGQGIRRAGLW
jgi:hypothetical protein